MGQGLLHARSTKSVGAEPTRAQPADAQFSRSVKYDRKGKYGVTVPEPFDFDIRETTRPKTIREQKIEEMIEEKRWEDSCKNTIKSRPIPSKVLEP